MQKVFFFDINALSYPHVEFCMLSNNIMDYYFVAQGKTTIPNVDDGEELTLTDVRYFPTLSVLETILKISPVIDQTNSGNLDLLRMHDPFEHTQPW